MINNEQFLEELKKIFSLEGVLTGGEKIEDLSFDKCPRNLLEKNPKHISCAVVRPTQRNYKKQLVDLIRLVKRFEKKIVVRGGGSGVCGAAVPRDGKNTVIVDITSLNDIHEVNLGKKYVIAGAGIFGDKLEESLNQNFNYTLGHSPASLAISTPGGWVAARSSGQFSARYGNIDDLVLGIEVITRDGRVLFIEKKELSSFLGMEGITGIITKVKMKIFPFSKHRSFLTFSFPKIKTAISTLNYIFAERDHWKRKGIYVSAVRLYDFLDYRLIAKPYKHDSASKTAKLRIKIEKWIIQKARWLNVGLGLLERLNLARSYMIVVLESEHKQALDIVSGRLNRLVSIEEFKGKQEKAEVARTWHQNRFKLSYEKMLERAKIGLIIDTFDCRPKKFDKTLEIYNSVRKSVKDVALIGAHVGIDLHGPYIYFTFISAAKTLEARKKMYESIWWKRMIPACIQSGGWITHHHGIGFMKGGQDNKLVHYAYGQKWLLKTAVPAKKEFDPGDVFNPGNLV